MKYPRPRLSYLEIAEPEVRRLERVHLQYITTVPRHDRIKREGELKRVQNQILILDEHAETELRIGPAVAELGIAQNPERIGKKGTESETDEIPGCIRLGLKRKQQTTAPGQLRA